jgi:hypothetical protein
MTNELSKKICDLCGIEPNIKITYCIGEDNIFSVTESKTRINKLADDLTERSPIEIMIDKACGV